MARTCDVDALDVVVHRRDTRHLLDVERVLVLAGGVAGGVAQAPVDDAVLVAPEDVVAPRHLAPLRRRLIVPRLKQLLDELMLLVRQPALLGYAGVEFLARTPPHEL